MNDEDLGGEDLLVPKVIVGRQPASCRPLVESSTSRLPVVATAERALWSEVDRRRSEVGQLVARQFAGAQRWPRKRDPKCGEPASWLGAVRG